MRLSGRSARSKPPGCDSSWRAWRHLSPRSWIYARLRRSSAAPRSSTAVTGDTRENGGASVSKDLELSNETKANLRELRILSEKAEAGETGARRELRRA